MMFITLDAVDVAFTEASVGAGISTILFLAVMAYLPKKEEESIDSEFIPVLSCIILGGILIWCSFDLPEKIWNRKDKMGHNVPADEWWRGNLRDRFNFLFRPRPT